MSSRHHYSAAGYPGIRAGVLDRPRHPGLIERLPAVLRRWESLFIMLVMFLGTWALLPLLRQDAKKGLEDGAQGDPVSGVIWAALYVVCFALIARHARAWLEVIGKDKFLAALVAWISVSVLWSEQPAASARHLVFFLGASAAGSYFAARLQWKTLWLLLRVVLAVITVLSLVFGLLLPSYGIYLDNGLVAWQGIMPGKNVLGRVEAFSAAIWLLDAYDRPRFRPVSLALLVISLALVVLSTSKTALVVGLGVLAIIPLIRLTRSGSARATLMLLAALMAAGAAGLLLADNVDTILGLLGRNATLSGRTDLWDLVWESILSRPWFGYGYAGFWLGWDGPSSIIWSHASWLPPNSHDAFLDVWLDTGFVGLALVGLSLFRAFSRSLRLARTKFSQQAVFCLTFLAFLILSNLTETNLLTYNSTFWMLYVVVAIGLTNEQIETARVHSPQLGLVHRTPVRRPAAASIAWMMAGVDSPDA